MKVISMLQPWATLVVIGVIRTETRTWFTKHRGPILIHASQRKSGKSVMHHPLLRKYITDFNALPFGAIIGQVTIIDILPANDYAHSESGRRLLTRLEKWMGDYSIGKWAWVLRDAVPYQEVIEAKGMLGLWEWGDKYI